MLLYVKMNILCRYHTPVCMSDVGVSMCVLFVDAGRST